MPALLVNTISVSPGQSKPTIILTAHHESTTRRASSSRHSCRAEASTGGVRGDYDLYELLGVERSSPQLEIKAAYRSLQKRCHPDVAGAAEGHDMAIVLNEVYALLSDPAARLAYDQEQARRSEFAGYTGRPLYSSWLGADAVFVDEVRCVGCLKCALHASRTFAVESVYGRARVVAQWADAEDKINDAISTAPSTMVERSDLAALEFLMSKQPRGRDRVSEGNAVGARAPNIFNDNEVKSQKKIRRDEAEICNKGIPGVGDSRGLQQLTPSEPCQTGGTGAHSVHRRRPPSSSLRASCRRRRRHLLKPPLTPWRKGSKKLSPPGASQEGATTATARRDDYWTPQLNLPSSASPPSIHLRGRDAPRRRRAAAGRKKGASIDLTTPLMLGIISAGFVGYNGEEMAGGGCQEHFGGAVALGIVNSFEMK